MNTTIITSENRRFELNLKELWAYRDLILLFTGRNFTIFYKQTILGPAWAIINPLISSVFYLIVFGRIAGLGTDGIPQMLFYLSGTAIWNFFATCVNKNSVIFKDNAAVFGKVYFPRMTVGISNVLSAGIDFSIQLVLVLAITVFYMISGQVSVNPLSWLLIPIIWLHIGVLGMGCGIIVSSLTTKYRDLSILVTFLVSLWMYATPVVYPMSTVSDQWLRIILKINPVTAPVEMYRYCLFGSGQPDWLSYGISAAVTIVIAVLGVGVFNKVEKNFIDTI